MPLGSLWGFRSTSSGSGFKLEEEIRKLAELWELLVNQINLLFRVMKLMNTLDETATYAELVRQRQPSQVEDYYPKLKELAQPIVRLLRAFIARKAAIEDLRYFGAFEVVAYDLKRINKGYHRLITDSFGYLPENLKEEAGKIKREVDEAFIDVLDVYKVSI